MNLVVLENVCNLCFGKHCDNKASSFRKLAENAIAATAEMVNSEFVNVLTVNLATVIVFSSFQ